VLYGKVLDNFSIGSYTERFYITHYWRVVMLRFSV
jgi:hypothetical protein